MNSPPADLLSNGLRPVVTLASFGGLPELASRFHGIATQERRAC